MHSYAEKLGNRIRISGETELWDLVLPDHGDDPYYSDPLPQRCQGCLRAALLHDGFCESCWDEAERMRQPPTADWMVAAVVVTVSVAALVALMAVQG